MDFEMENCIDCNRLIASDATSDLGDICYVQYDLDLGLIEDTIANQQNATPSEIATQTRLPIKRIRQILEHQKITANETDSDSTCTRCNEKPALSHSRFCLTCQLAVYKTLGDEANVSTQNPVKAMEKSDSSIQSLKETMNMKRTCRIHSIYPKLIHQREPATIAHGFPLVAFS